MYNQNRDSSDPKKQQGSIMDDIVRDTILVSRIDVTFKEMEDELIKDGNLEKEQIAAEYESMVRKQLQMLQADERGRQALQNEISEMSRKQEKRAEMLRRRARALEIEKERAKRIASRPPPLPRSVRLLLKDQAKKDLELTSENVHMSPSEDYLEEDAEDKENINEELLAEKQKMQEEWNKKAKKRFNEALKKDRKKQEHDTILKEIEDAEKLNRRLMARNISEPAGKVPCYLPDKLRYAEKQMAMEDGVEDVFIQKNPKEHAVEDLEGYQDKWESKYKQIDSVMESKMVDCVPSFVRNNYSYLLQEETSLHCGRNFTGLEDGTDLNEAYIESPPADVMNNSREIDVVVSQLDQMRLELNEAYEKEFKPLLEAGGLSKAVSHDKAVEANFLKLPTEDKAVEAERTPPKKGSSSRGIQADLLQGGVMSFQRRDLGKTYKSLTNTSSRYLPQFFASPPDSASEARSPRNALESWSSSSYWSLPSKHGLPKACKFCDSPGCSIPLVEDVKLHKDCVPLAKSQSDDLTVKGHLTANDSDDLVKGGDSPNGEFISSDIKSKLASYIRLVAEKYLKKSANSPESNSASKEISPISDQAFSKLKISESDEISDRRTAPTELAETPSTSPEEMFQKKGVADASVNTCDAAKQLGDDHPKCNLLKSLNDALNCSSEDELLRNCREVIAENIRNSFSADNRIESESPEVSCSTLSSDGTVEQPYNKESLTGYVYHDLSTIQEMDSAITNDSKESLRGEAQKSLEKNSDLGEISSDEVDTTSVSLVDAPDSVVSEIAKSIRFIQKPMPEPIEIDGASTEHEPLVSGTLSDFQTPSSVVSKGLSTKHQISDDQLSNFDSGTDTKTISRGSGSNELLTPSPVSTVKSVSAANSQRYPYSSSYQDSKATKSSALSKYFQDISSIRPESEPSSKVEDEFPLQKATKKQSPGAFLPMTPHSYMSTPIHQGSSGGIFLPMTPHSYLSTLGEITGNQKEQNNVKRTHLSSLQNKHDLGIFKTPESNVGSFKALTPHSYFSGFSTEHSSLNSKPFSPRKDGNSASRIGVSSQQYIGDANPDSFKPLSLISNVSTPASNQTDPQLPKDNAGYQHQRFSSDDFQPMSPHSDISSLSDVHASSRNNLNGFSTGKEPRKGSINVRLRIPNPFVNKTASPNVTGKDPKSFTYPIQLRLNVKDITDASEGAVAQQDSSIARQTSNKPASKNRSGAKIKRAEQVASSGFVPHLTFDDFTSSEKNLIQKNKKDISAAKMSALAKNSAGSPTGPPDRVLHSPNNEFPFPSHKSSLKNSASTINNDLKTSSSSVGNVRGCSSPSEPSSVSPNPILQAMAQVASSGKLNTPFATPSNASSAESLSEMFVDSKINYKSTPIKSVEELIQETGILEEPTLTLLNTETTLKPDSPEKSRYQPEGSLNTPSTLPSTFFTPSTLDTPSDTASAACYDSPSMISFLKHEQSCSTPVIEETKYSDKKTNQDDYKKRTKRLWNNLEEVRAKKLFEERKEQMRKNRLKMKTYSKKWPTPEKK